MRKKVILVIDDDEMNLQIAKMVLERKLPCKVIGATNGVEGIEILKTKRVNLVLLDVLMPDFDGIETLQEIRNDEMIKDVPVMMLTASGDMENVRESRRLGVKDYIKKPFLPADLVARVEKKLAEEPPSTDILIIGNDYKVLENLKEVIENNFNHEILIAADYDDAIEILRETNLSLIIACGEMEFIDGFKILAYIAGDEKFKSVPFAVTTLSKILLLIDKLNQPEAEEPEVAEPPVVEEPPAIEEPPAVKEPPAVEEVAEAVIAHAEKKKLAKVVTNLIGYDLDVRI